MSHSGQYQPKLQSLTDWAVFATIRLEVEYANNSKGFATAFHYNYGTMQQPDTQIVLTNKHVIKNATKAFLTVRERKGTTLTRDSFRIIIDDFENQWIGHPEGDLDLCALPESVILDEAARLGKQIWHTNISKEQLPTPMDLDAMYAAEDVLMIGYPIGLWDEINNLPFIRRGITSTPPAVNYQNQPYGYIDAACVPGSSGSPVFIVRESNQSPLRGTGGMSEGAAPSTIVLLGVHDRKITWRPDGSISLQDNIDQRPAHLGRYIKAAEINSMHNTIKNSINSNTRVLAWEE